MLGILMKKMDLLTENYETIKNEIKDIKKHNSLVLDAIGTKYYTTDEESYKTFTNEIKDIKKQNTLVLDVLSENTIAIKNSIKDCVPKYTKQFPIKTLEDLEKLENDINDANEKEYCASVRAIAGVRGLKKGLLEIALPKLLNEFNVDGIHNKKRILNYPKFISILFAGTYTEGCTDKSFKDDLRAAFKLAKNRHFKGKKTNTSKENEPKQIAQDNIQNGINNLLSAI